METTKILVLDDDINVLEAIHESMNLLNHSFSPIFETDPKKALALIKSDIFDLVFCDYIFSGSIITGLEIFAEIKKVYCNRVWIGVLLTGAGTAGLFVNEQVSGLFSDCIEKPFSEFNNLKEKINNAIALLTRRRGTEDRLKTASAEPGV